jgi:hypothetical protein
VGRDQPPLFRKPPARLHELVRDGTGRPQGTEKSRTTLAHSLESFCLVRH